LSALVAIMVSALLEKNKMTSATLHHYFDEAPCTS
jgi:hypothetical protein